MAGAERFADGTLAIFVAGVEYPEFDWYGSVDVDRGGWKAVLLGPRTLLGAQREPDRPGIVLRRLSCLSGGSGLT